MSVVYDRLTQDQILVTMGDGWELIRDDLGDWLFSGATWHLMEQGTATTLVEDGLIERHWSRNDPMLESFEDGYRLTAKGRQRAGLVAPFVKVMDDSVRTTHERRLTTIYFWITMGLVSLAILIHYVTKGP